MAEDIEVPDEILEAMGGEVPEVEPKEEAETKEIEEKQEKQEKTEETGEEPEKAAKTEEKPVRDAEYYRKKGERTRERIKELTTARYEAEQAIEREREERRQEREQFEARIRELEQRSVSTDDLDEEIELAKEEGKDHIVKILEAAKRERLNPHQQEQRQQPQQQHQQETQQIHPEAEKWINANTWFNDTDDLGRVKYPQLQAEAMNRERALRATMPVGPALYKRLSEEMHDTLEAYGLVDEPAEEPPKNPGLQPNRGGGAEREPKRNGQLSDAEFKRMRAIFRHTGMDPDNPEHRKIYIENLRSA